MDELDRDGSSGRQLVAAGAAAAVFAALALGLTRRKTVLAPGAEQSVPNGVGVEDPPAATATPPDVRRLAEQVAEIAPEVVAALEQHAPETARRLRDRLAILRRRVREDATEAREIEAAATEAAAEVVREVEAEAHTDGRDRGLSAAQTAAARAAAAAVARAERAMASGEKLAGSARARSEGVADDVVPALREIAQQAAEHAIELWQAARTRGTDVAHHARIDLAGQRERAEHLAEDVAERTQEAEEALRERVKDAEERVEDKVRAAKAAARDKADEVSERVHETTEEVVDAGKEAGAAFMWLAAALGLIFYVLMSEERREQLVRFSDEASVQLRELLRDIRGYDDEF